MSSHDPVNHPKHYTDHPSGIECIQITEHMSFNLGNALKYIWRCDLKKDAIEDLKKARWYIDREVSLREKGVEKIASASDKPNDERGYLAIGEHAAWAQCPKHKDRAHVYIRLPTGRYADCACGRPAPADLPTT